MAKQKAAVIPLSLFPNLHDPRITRAPPGGDELQWHLGAAVVQQVVKLEARGGKAKESGSRGPGPPAAQIWQHVSHLPLCSARSSGTGKVVGKRAQWEVLPSQL